VFNTRALDGATEMTQLRRQS